jgi:hypothetical protein
MNPNLSEAIKARDTAAADIIELNKKIEKLETAAARTCPAVAELARLRDDAARAAAHWDGEGELPAVDHKRAARLADEIAAHDLSQQSARDGIRTLIDRRTVADSTRDSANRYATVAAITHVLETEDRRLVAELNEVRQHHADLNATRNALHEAVLSQARQLDERQLFTAVESVRKVLFEQIVGKANLAPFNEIIASMLAPKELV